MAVYDLEEQEKLDDLKAWWQQYGKYISTALSVIAVAVVATQGWRWYQSHQSEQASVLYQAVSQAGRNNDVAKAKEPATQIEDRFAGTAYAPRAALLYARMLYDAGDRAGARAQLQWVVEHSSEEELKTVARFRLAEALLDDKQYDEALRTLDVKTDDAFAAMYADLRGDVLIAAGKPAEAKAAYQLALAKIDPKSPYRAYIQVKYDALGGSAS
ncbi:MAG: tetratricopeptide repeat protein [Betaproteobacteria bacterium]|nr:MAG: tetratricopeptide repeat protein [Betaproteobacteria bacterium]